MKRQSVLTVAVLALGLAMLVWGEREFASHKQPKLAKTTDDDGGPNLRMCPLTAGELAEELGLGLAVRKVAYLAVAGVGLFIAGGLLLSVILRRSMRERAGQPFACAGRYGDVQDALGRADSDPQS